MKYMGSKRAMLRNGLGDLLNREASQANRFVDLFTGSAAVAHHVAQRFDIPVLASDLQQYSVVLANSVISRNRVLDVDRIWKSWFSAASAYRSKIDTPSIHRDRITKAAVDRQRLWCAAQELPITESYGGHYFCAAQSVWIDALRATLPSNRESRQAALASLIQAASYCAASPGHTAQPFQPTETGKKFLGEAWAKDLPEQTKKYLTLICAMSAREKGAAVKLDANLMAQQLEPRDLVFVDPPYSGVHYSRFYHVLETIARGSAGVVSGVGRYPPGHERPRSSYSVQTESAVAFDQLLRIVSKAGATAIVTFPDHDCSNGLSGNQVIKIAKSYFKVQRKTVASKFSSLGGTSDNRGDQAGRTARVSASELILTLTPR